MSVARRSVAALTGAVLAFAGLAAVAAPARAADTVTALGLATFSRMAVDDAHQQVFLAGGASNTIEVRGFDGSLKGTVTGQTGAADVAVSPDGSAVFAALDGTGSVSRISTTTLTETARYTVSADTCVSSVAFAGPRLFVSYGCSTRTVAELDLGQATPAPGTPLATSGSDAPFLAGDATGTHLVALVRLGVLTSYDLAAGTSASTTALGDNCQSAAVEPTLGDVVVACGFPYVHEAFSSTDLMLSHTYPTTNYPNAVAATDRGVAAGVENASSTDVFVFARHTTTPLRRIDVDLTGSRGWTLAPRGLAFAADSSKLFAVSVNGSSGALRLHVYGNPLAQASTLTLTAPATSRRTAALTVTGTLAGTPALPAGTPLTVTKTDLAGTRTLASVTTDAAGAFTVHDTPSIGGTNRYTVTYAGDVGHRAVSASKSVSVSRVTPSLAVTTNASTYGYKATVTVTAHLGRTYNGRTVRIYATPYGFSKVLVGSGTVNAAGDLTLRRVVTQRTTFSAVFPGDHRYATRTVTRTVAVRASVAETMSGHYATSGSTYLFRPAVDPILAVKVSPHRAGHCIRFTVQRYSAGAWRAWASSACTIRLDSTSAAAAHLTGSHPTGYRFRMRAEFLGTTVSAGKNGAWKSFRFS